MSSLRERQIAVLGGIVGGDSGRAEAARAARLRKGADLSNLASTVRNGRKRRIRAVLPKTIEAIWIEFGAIFDAYAVHCHPGSIDPADEGRAFVAFLRTQLSQLEFAPPYLDDLAHFELCLHEIKNSLLPADPRAISERPAVHAICAVWQGHYDLAELFRGRAIALDVPQAMTVCILWRSERDGRTRVASVSPAVGERLRALRGGNPTDRVEKDDEDRALASLGLVGDASVEWSFIDCLRNEGVFAENSG